MSVPIKPPTSQTIDAYRAAVLAWRASYDPSKWDGLRRSAAVAAVRKLRPGLSDDEAEELALDAIDWAKQVPNECFWDL